MSRFPLVLFDIDGTLLARGDPTHGQGVLLACKEVFGVEADPHRAGVDLAGRTDRYIIRALMVAYGVPEVTINARMAATFEAVERYVAREIPDSVAERLLPGVTELLDALVERDQVLGLVTGNLPGVARAKLGAAGIWAPFARGDEVIGGFGDISVDRNDLPPAALMVAARLLDHPPGFDEVVVIGDTPHDIACGRAIDARTIGVATGRYAAGDLEEAGADLVLPDLTDRERVLCFLDDPPA